MTIQDWHIKLALADDIDDISEVFRQLFQDDIPPSNSPYFKDTMNSVTISLDKLIAREQAKSSRVVNAHKHMTAAKDGTGEKRKPIHVIDMGNGKYKVLDGNTTLQALRDLGETDAVVEIKKSLKQQGVSNPKSIDAVYEQAEKALPLFKEWVEEYGKKTGGKVMLRPGLKGADRAQQKVDNDYGGFANRLTDIIGGMIVFDSADQVAKAFSLISKDPAVYKCKNRFENPTADGYRDVLMVINIGGHLCELQLNTERIIEAKERGLGHKLYDITRQLDPIAKNENNGDLAFMASGYIEAFRKVSVKLYRNAAMSSAISSANNMASDSEIDDEYDRILQRLSESSISTHFPIDLPSIRKMQPVDISIAKATSSFSTKLNLSDNIKNPPFDTQNITRNGKNVNAKVITGRRTRAYLNDDTELALQYAVIEARDLVSSHNLDFSLNPEFPQDLQPRDRTRDTMRGQIAAIAGGLNPDRLGGSLYASVGSPVVGRDMVVESGNGRTMGIKQRYANDGAPDYKEWILLNAVNFGFDLAAVKNFDQPVLVRIRLSGDDRKHVTERANESDAAKMSPVEQAKVDDGRLTAGDMETFSPSKEGDITAATNGEFIQRFITKMGTSESAGMLTADSRPTKALVDRIQAAIFSKAYADERMLTLMAEETNPAVKNVLTALTAAAPVFAKIRASYPDMGGIKLIDNIVDATRLMLQARDNGENIETVLAQMGLFEQIPEETKAVTRILESNIRKSKHLGIVFKTAGERILSFLQNRNQGDLFGDAPAPPTSAEIISDAVEKAEELNPSKAQKGLFESADAAIIDEESYLAMNGASRFDFGDSALHKNKGKHSDKTWQKIIDLQSQKDNDLAAKRDGLRAEYAQKVASGEIRPPTRTETLMTVAQGHPDNESVKAARRILDKKGIKWQTSPWRLDIRNAKTFQDIAYIFNCEFGVTVNDDPVMEAAQIRTPLTVEENIQRGTEAMNRVIAKHVNEPRAMYRQDLGWIAFYWGTPGKEPPSFSDQEDMLAWWNGLKNKFGLFPGGSGVSHIIAKRDWEGKYIRPLIGQSGLGFSHKIPVIIAKGKIILASGGRAVIEHGDYTATLSLNRFGEDEVWLVSGCEKVDRSDYELINESSDNSGLSQIQPESTHTRATLSRPDMGAEGSKSFNQKVTLPTDNVNMVFESSDQKEPWQMTRKEYRDSDKQLIAAYTAKTKAQETVIGSGDRWGDTRRFQGKAAGNRIDTVTKATERWSNAFDAAETRHRKSVQQAVNLREPVPSEVLADYPEFKKATTETWANDIMSAETFEDIEAVFKREFPDAFNQTSGSEYVDTGEKIGGARKDVWKAILDGNRTLNIKDMDGMDSGTASKMVNKTNVVQGMVDTFRDSGFDPGAVFMITKLYGTYAIKPSDTDQSRIDYVAAADRVNDYLKTAKTVDGFASVLKQIRAEIYGVSMTPEQKAMQEDMHARSKQFSDLSNARWMEIIKDPKYHTKGGMSFKSDQANTDYYKWQTDVKEEYLPNDLSRQYNQMLTELNKQADADPTSARNQYKALGDRFIDAINMKSKAFKGSLSIAKNIKDFSWMEKETGKTVREKVEKPKWERYVPENVERTGGGDRTFTPQELIDMFGIRGVEYGNWMDHESSEHHTQMLGLSFMDMSDVLGIPAKHISHGGKLAIAFGARGVGGFSAHYEPYKKAINMTKISGGGSLAHEWGHFLDNVMSVVASDGKEQFSHITDSLAAQKAYIKDESGKMRRQPEPLGNGIPQAVKDALIDLHTAMTGGTAGGKTSDAAKNKYRSMIDIDNDIAKGIDPQKVMDDAYLKEYTGKYRGRVPFADVAHYIQHKTGKQVSYDRKNSEFYARSAAMTKSADSYWTRPTEMLARAFECYISDKMKDAGRANSYLVSGVSEVVLGSHAPYPIGDERKRINDAFDKLIDALKGDQIFESFMMIQKWVLS